MSTTLTDAQRQELRDAFDTFDADGSGRISSGELAKVFRALNIKVNEDQLNDAVARMDSNESGQIEFDEFSRVMAETFFKTHTQDELRAAFDQFDQDGSGYIQTSELESIMAKMGRRYSREEIDCIVQSLDKSGDSKIGFDEFCRLFQ